MLGEKGFNEMDCNLFKHLLSNKKAVAFVRTQCDSSVKGIQNSFDDQCDDVVLIITLLSKT